MSETPSARAPASRRPPRTWRIARPNPTGWSLVPDCSSCTRVGMDGPPLPSPANQDRRAAGHEAHLSSAIFRASGQLGVRLVGTVLHLPGVVEGVPGDAAGGVALRSTCGRRAAAVGRLAQDLEHRGAHRPRPPPRRRVAAACSLMPELAGVGRSPHSIDVADHLVAVAAAAARTLAELGGRAGGDPVEVVQAASTSAARRVGLGGASVGRRSASVTRLGTPKSVPRPPRCRSTTSSVERRREVEPGLLGDERVARRVGEQRLDRELLGLARARPAGPVERRRERSSSAPRSIATARRRRPSGSRGEGSAGLAAAQRDEARQRGDVAPVRTERIDQRGGDDHAVGAGLRERPDVRRPADPEPDPDRDRRRAP